MVDKLNINEEMRVIDTKDRSWWDTLTEEEVEKFSKGMWTQMRWATSVTGGKEAEYLLLVNSYVNEHFNVLAKHQRLQHQLLQIAGSEGKVRPRKWLPPGKRGKKNKLIDWLVTQYPQCNNDELEIIAATTDKKEFRDIMEQQGMKPKEIKELLK
jgi:hypothetical protein